MAREQLAQRRLMFGVGVSVKETLGDRRVPAIAKQRDEVARDRDTIETGRYGAIRQNALVDFEAVLTIDDGQWLLISEVVDVIPIVPLQREDILESARRDQGDRIALTFDDGVCRHGCAVR